MKIYKQIIIEIFQKPFRTFILFFTLFILALCMLSSVYIKLAIDASYQKQIEIDGYCIDVEKDNVVEFEDWKKCIDTILSIDGMVGYNNSVEYSTSCKTVGFENCAYEEAKLTKKEKKEVFLVGNIDTKLHSYFRNGKMVLLEGKYPTLEKKGTLIAVELAEKNKIQIGDIVEVESQNEKNIGTEVIGIYETKEIPKIESEHEGFYKKSKNSFIFCDLSTYQQINPNTEKVTILSFFTDNYSILGKNYKLISQLYEDDEEFLVVNTVSNNMSEIKETINILRVIANAIMYAVIGCIFVVVGAIAALWIYDHIKTIQLYRILGQNQAVIVLKILGELLPIILISVGMAMITSHILFPQTLIKQLTRIVDYENILQMRDAMGISIWNNCIIFVAIVLGVCLSVAIVLTNLSISKLRKIR